MFFICYKLRSIHGITYIKKFCLLILLVGSAKAGPVGTVLKWQEHDLPHTCKSHKQVITTSPFEYNVSMAGTVDLDHALTRQYNIWRIGFQPNESLIIANTGPVPVENAKLIINNRGNWYSLPEMIQEAHLSAQTDQDKVYLIWQFARSNRHHDDPVYGSLFQEELHDPVKMLVIYGAGLCDDSGSIGASLFQAAGLNQQEPFVRSLHGHMMCEVFNAGRFQFMDIDENVFYLDRENELPVSGDTVAHDHDLAHREIHFGPVFSSWEASRSAASLFGIDDSRTTRLTKGYKIEVNLRPSERIEYRWDNLGKWSMNMPPQERRFVGNSRKIYEPRLDSPYAGADEAQNISLIKINNKPAAAADNSEGTLTYRMNSTFVFCGGHIAASFNLRDKSDQAFIEAWAQDNKGEGKTEPVLLWHTSGPGAKNAEVEIDQAIDPSHGRPEYEFFVRVRLVSASAPQSASLTSHSIRGDIMVSPLFLPRLRLGTNQVVYSDDSPPDRRVLVTYNWRETTATQPLPPPKLLYPQDQQTIRDDIVTYKWQPIEGAQAYHLLVSRDPDFRWPYRPSLDVVYKGTEYSVPFWGIYSPDTTYYWRLRTQNDKGIWGDLSKTHTFQWSGPRVPLNVKLTEQDGIFTLSWKPNPRGPRPDHYEIYSSDIKGFSISKVPYQVPTLGEVPANYLGQTASTSLIVAGPLDRNNLPPSVTDVANLNRCYYRVVAVDKNGTHSGCSDYAQMPHPYIWTTPLTTAQPGQPYCYQPGIISNLGDLQHRYETKPLERFWQREQISFALVKGPQWLKLDSKTGLLTGTPPADSQGSHPVQLRVTATFAKRTGKDRYMDDLTPRTYDQTFNLLVTTPDK